MNKAKIGEATTLIISMGWMTQVANMPEAPPFTKGFTDGHTPFDLGFSSPISLHFQVEKTRVMR